ncbi:MAG: hypothetical protein ACLFP8_06870 [Alphaproteobacteria bacterium]
MILLQTQNFNLKPSDKKKNIFALFFNYMFGVCTIFLLFSCLFFARNTIEDFPIEFLLLFLNGCLSIYGMIVSIKRNASIHFVSFLFSYLFMSLAPIAQIGANLDPVFKMDFILIITVLTILIFTLTGVFFIQKLPVDFEKKTEKETKQPDTHHNYYLLFWVTLIVSLFAIFLFRHGLFTSREGMGIAMGQIFRNHEIALIALVLLKLVPFYGATIGLRSAWEEQRKGKLMLFSFLLLLALILNNPMSSARYHLAGVAFFFIDYMTKGRKTHLLAACLIIGIISAPLFHTFRRENPSTVAIHKEETLMDRTLLAMDYDAFQIACYTVLTVREDGITWGSNIAGAILFFVPRRFWPEKPPQTSHVIYDTMIEHRSVGTNNLSTPLMAEGYYAFSFLGVIAISLLYWALISKIVEISRDASKSANFLFRSIATGLVLIFLRGSLIVAMSAIVGFSIAGLIPWILFYLGSNHKKHLLKSKNQILDLIK